MDSAGISSSAKGLRCAIIGAGLSGLLMAYKLREHLKDHVEFVIYEKSPDLGGTWYENRYPGCACDVPSHVYQFSFAPNPSWSKFFASSEEIQRYLKQVAKTFDIEKFIKYNSTVTTARWSEHSGTWALEINGRETVDYHILVNAGGILNNPNIPSLEGLSSFSGPQLHTAAWDSEVELAGKRIAIIGAGASAIQVLPQIQPVADHVDIFIRTPSWITTPVGLGPSDPDNPVYTETEKEQFRNDRNHYLQTRKNLESNFNGIFRAFMKSSPQQQALRAEMEEGMKARISDENLRKRMIPTFEAGCRRMSPGIPYLRAIQKENVQPVFDQIDRISPHGVVCNGKEYQCDVLILATGFNTSFRPRFPIIGRDGVNLQDLWSEAPISYMGTGVSGFPNYLTFLGPNTPISNGSVIGALEATSDYFIRLLRKVLRQKVKSFNVRLEAQQDFDRHTQSVMKEMVWTGTCRSWFKKGLDGRVTALWPGSTLHYMQTLAENRWEDYHWEYKEERFAYWGSGISWVEDPNLDKLGQDERESMTLMTTTPYKSSDISFYLWESDPIANGTESLKSITEEPVTVEVPETYLDNSPQPVNIQ